MRVLTQGLARLDSANSSCFGKVPMMEFLRRLLHSEDGPTAVEYAVMIALIVIVCIGSVRSMGGQTANSIEDSATQISDAMNP